MKRWVVHMFELFTFRVWEGYPILELSCACNARIAENKDGSSRSQSFANETSYTTWLKWLRWQVGSSLADATPSSHPYITFFKYHLDRM